MQIRVHVYKHDQLMAISLFIDKDKIGFILVQDSFQQNTTSVFRCFVRSSAKRTATNSQKYFLTSV